jgi:hypothetical protein
MKIRVVKDQSKEYQVIIKNIKTEGSTSLHTKNVKEIGKALYDIRRVSKALSP